MDAAAAIVRIKEIDDERSRLRKADGELAEERKQIEREMMRTMESLGVESIDAAGYRFAVRHKLVAAYDPDRWPELVAELAAMGRGDIITRGLKSAAVQSALEAGEPLPDGIRLDTVKTTSLRKIG